MEKFPRTGIKVESETETEFDNDEFLKKKNDPNGNCNLKLPVDQLQMSIENEEIEKPDWRKDIGAILLLFFLYILQGIPLGLISTIPFILQSRGVPYVDQAKFSLAYWPFSFKVLYAPIVDAFYFPKIGRRKSWLIPMQYLISIFLFFLAFKIDGLLEDKNVGVITAAFFILNFLAATQDITVDGWALTMLSKGNLGYASTCNAVGQTLGAVVSYSGFLSLNSEDFANKFFRSVPKEGGLITLPQFLLFWAIVFAVTTTLVFIFKKEAPEILQVSEQRSDIFASYLNLYKILKLRNIHYLILFYLTAQIGNAATNAVSRLKLVDKGVSKEEVAFIAIPLIPIKLLIPILISKFTAGPKPMSVWMKAYPSSLLFSIILPLFIFFTPGMKNSETGGFPFYYYVLLFLIFAFQLLPGYTMFVAGMAFSAKISDPAIGGTYMTLINTVSNVGSMWVSTVVLWLVDYATISLPEKCIGNEWDKYFQTNATSHGKTSYHIGNFSEFSTSTESVDLILLDGDCSKNVVDGYYIESLVCLVLGFVWLAWSRPVIKKLQKRPLKSWKVFT